MSENQQSPADALPTTSVETTIDTGQNVTQFRNLYIPSFQLPPQDNRTTLKSKESGANKSRYRTQPGSDRAAKQLGDTTRVGWKGRVDYAIDAYKVQEMRARATENEIQRDPTALLNVAITTVILLASKVYDFPMEYYLYTELYLESIRDEYNDYPPNIENLLKHIRFVRQEKNITWHPSESIEEPPGELMVTKLPKRSRIPKPAAGRDRSNGSGGLGQNVNSTATDATEKEKGGSKTPPTQGGSGSQPQKNQNDIDRNSPDILAYST